MEDAMEIFYDNKVLSVVIAVVILVQVVMGVLVILSD